MADALTMPPSPLARASDLAHRLEQRGLHDDAAEAHAVACALGWHVIELERLRARDARDARDARQAWPGLRVGGTDAG